MSAVVTFTRHSLAFLIVYAPKIALRRCTRSVAAALRYLLKLFEQLVGHHRLSWLIEVLAALFPSVVLTMSRSPWSNPPWNLRQETVLEMFRYMYTQERDVVRKYVRFLSGVLKPKRTTVTLVKNEVKYLSHPFEGYWVRSRTQTSTAQQGKQTVLFYIHGGAFYTGSALMQVGMLERMIHHYELTAPGSTLAIFSLEYGLSPEHPFPHALHQAVEAYAWLVRQGYSKIVIGGDSAGGNLATSATLVIRDSYPELPLPPCLLLLSPWLDLTVETPQELERQTFFGTDIISPCKVIEIKEAYLGPNYNDLVTNHLVSPMRADLTGLPPMLVNAGGAENLLADIECFVDKLEASNVPVTFDVDDHMVHVYPTLVDALAHPAAESAIQRFAEFMVQHCETPDEVKDGTVRCIDVECGLLLCGGAMREGEGERSPFAGVAEAYGRTRKDSADCTGMPFCERHLHCCDSVASVTSFDTKSRGRLPSGPKGVAHGDMKFNLKGGYAFSQPLKGGHGSPGGLGDALDLLEGAGGKLQVVDNMMEDLMILQKCAMQLLC